VQPARKSDLIPGANDKTPVMFIACRLSREKGIFDLPEIIREARLSVPGLKIVVAGSGPASADLQREMPDAVFLGWQSREQLASLYLGLDLFVFPSRFDTFGNVLLEALTHGMPALAYNCKGPKDIIEHDVSGYLLEDIDAMAEAVVHFFSDPTARKVMAENARNRAAQFQAEPIMRQFLTNLGLDYPEQVSAEVTVA
jgi:glycosyltransferase involved in cell wall biosynthesis